MRDVDALVAELRDLKRIIGKATGQKFVRAQEASGEKVIDKLARAGFVIVRAAALESERSRADRLEKRSSPTEAIAIAREVRDKTRDIAVKAIESLLTDKQGLGLDDYTIRACASIVHSLGRTALGKEDVR